MAAESQGTSVGEVVEFVKTYARQETVGPLKGAGRWIQWGLLGSVLLTIGFVFVALGLLRLLQTELFTGRTWSFVPYIIVATVCAVGVFLALKRIDKKYLYKDNA